MSERVTVEQIELMKHWAVQAGQIACEWQDRATETLKSDNTPVTNADLIVERYLVQNIRAQFPGHKVIAEETGSTGPESDWVWAIDPIDGTKAFIRRLPVWGVSIGLLYKGIPAAGVIYLPVHQDIFWGWEGGAYSNDVLLRPSSRLDYDDERLFFAVHSQAHEQHALRYPRLRFSGSTVANMAFVAAGQAVGALLRRVHIWDLAAGMAVLSRAGFALEYLSGRPVDLNPLMDGRKCAEEILAARPEWMARLRAQIL